MATIEAFEGAAARIEAVPSLSPDRLLRLYALYKQATLGDVSGARPGLLDFKGRAKYDAWGAVRGMTAEAARAGYVALVDELLREA